MPILVNQSVTRMELWTGELSRWKCHWPDLKSTDLFQRNLFLNSLKTSNIVNPNPNPLANQLLCIDFLTPPTPLIIPHRLTAFLESLMSLKNRCSIHARWSKSSLKLSIQKLMDLLDDNNTYERRCPWWNGYRRRKWTQRLEFKSWTRMIAFHIALIPLGKVWIQLFSLQLWVNNRTDWVLQPWWGN